MNSKLFASVTIADSSRDVTQIKKDVCSALDFKNFLTGKS